MRTGQGAVAVLFGWEGNRRSGVTGGASQIPLYIHLRAKQPSRKGDEHPAYVPLRCIAPFVYLSCFTCAAIFAQTSTQREREGHVFQIFYLTGITIGKSPSIFNPFVLFYMAKMHENDGF